MGKHSDPDPRWFWLSLAAAAGKALLGVLIVGAVAVGVTTWAGGQGDPGAEPARTTEPATLAPEADAEEPETASPEPSPTGAATRPAEEETDGGDDAPVRATIQVLNASGDASALQEVIATLEELGYQVVAESRASRPYDRTTVFWSAGFDDDARELRRSDDRFGVLQPNDRLDRTINLHVVIGRDWAASDEDG